MKHSLVYHTTICIVPPESCWTQISDIRIQLQDKGYYRWPPHINLIYPCIHESKLDSFAPKLVENLKAIQPFDITLTGFNVFGGISRGVLYLEPDKSDSKNLNDLFIAIDNCVRNYSACSNTSDSTENVESANNVNNNNNNNNNNNKSKPFVPHLTVCHLPSAEIAWEASKQFTLQKINFKIDRVYALSRPENDPENVGQFGVAYTFFLGNDSIPLYENSRRFDSMPKEKYQWIVDSEKLYKKNSKWTKKSRKKQSKANKDSDNVSDQLKAEIPSTQSDIKNKEEIDKGNLLVKIMNFFLNLVPCNDEIWL